MAARYAVSAQVASLMVADRSPAMCGSDTFTTVESSTTMNVLAITADATIQGLTRGGTLASVAMMLAGVNGDDSRHAGAHLQIRSSLWSYRDLDGHALDDFHKIAARVIGRQQTERRAGRRRNAVDVSRVRAIVGIDRDTRRLSGPHTLELRLLEIRRDPDVVERRERE